MIPWQQIDSATVPGAEIELRLMRRGTEFSMMLGPNELMNSRLSGSEEALATLACRQIETVKAPHLLIGGLGMGFTLRAALAALGPDANVVVAKLVPAVVGWARGPMRDIFGTSLTDPRSDIRETDVGPLIRSARSAYDAIVLDPPAFAKTKRDLDAALRGYKELNLRALKMLRPGGVLVTCSCSYHVGQSDFLEMLAATALDARRTVRVAEVRGQSKDHPVLLNVPETAYLKCIIASVSY